MSFDVVIALLIYLHMTCMANINIKTNGEAWMCNLNPLDWKIQSLSPADQLLINKLEQVQIFHRHGARIGSRAIKDILPNANGLQYHCNISSIQNRQYQNNKYFTNIRKIYVQNEQIIEGNCQFRQAIKDLIPQFIANANILSNAYIGNKSYHIFNKYILTEIVSNISKYSTDLRISLQTTDYERTIASQIFLISQLFTDSLQTLNLNSITINTNVHDTTSDPYHPDDNQICINQNEYKQWIDIIENDQKLKNTAADDIINSEFGNKTISSFIKEGGKWISQKTGKYLLYPYCAGITLPLSNETFSNAVKLSYDWESTIKTSFNTTYAKDRNICIDHFNGIPMLNIILKYINLKTKLIFHSIHDTTLEMLLKVFKIWDGKLIIFGEMVTLEIYSKSENKSEYYFRITRKGKFIPHPLCNYNNNKTQLCDLNILLNDTFKDIVSQKEWSNEMCGKLITNCQCGYCDNDMSTTLWIDPCADNDNSEINLKSITFWAGICIGIVIGVFIIIIIVIIKKRACHREETIHANYFLSESNM